MRWQDVSAIDSPRCSESDKVGHFTGNTMSVTGKSARTEKTSEGGGFLRLTNLNERLGFI